jgi:hypothetical protein
MNTLHQITAANGYFLLQPMSFRVQEINDMFRCMPCIQGCFDQPHIWLLDDDDTPFQLSDVYRIRERTKILLPRGVSGQKTGIVVNDKIFPVLSEAYRTIAEDIPVTVRIFSSLESAEQWVREK